MNDLKMQLPAGIATMLVLFPLYASEGIDGIQVRLDADNLDTVQAGERVYRSHCASCHGNYLEGQPDWRTRGPDGLLPAPPHDAEGHTWHHADDLLFEITKYGPGAVIGDPGYRTSMPAYEKILTDAEIVAVLSFIKNTWPAEERQWQEEVNGNSVSPFSGSTGSSGRLDNLLKQ